MCGTYQSDKRVRTVRPRATVSRRGSRSRICPNIPTFKPEILLTPVESALPKNTPVTPLESALPGTCRQMPTKTTYLLMLVGLANTKWPHRVPVHALREHENAFYW